MRAPGRRDDRSRKRSVGEDVVLGSEGDGKLDWEAAKERLSRSARALEEALRPTPERARAMLEERARRLAKPQAASPDRDAGAAVVTFTRAGERYAIELRRLREVFAPAGLVAVPGAAAFWLGAANLRGELLPILELRRLFGLPEAERPERCWALVLGGDRPEFGVLADAVGEVGRVPLEGLAAPPEGAFPAARGWVRGVTAEAVVVLDGAALLEEPRLFAAEPDAGSGGGAGPASRKSDGGGGSHA